METSTDMSLDSEMLLQYMYKRRNDNNTEILSSPAFIDEVW